MNNRISQLRRDCHMTQEELAARCGVTRQTIISLEGGRYSPSILLAWKIARVFQLNIEQVFLFEEERL